LVADVDADVDVEINHGRMANSEELQYHGNTYTHDAE
jgi:hypothetical protein